MFKGILWDLFEKVSNQGIGFFISIILARLLSPEQFGLVGMVMVFVGMSQIFLYLGLGQALIQKRIVSDIEYSSVFYLNVFAGLVLTIILYFSSGLIAEFYQRPEVKPICEVLSVLFIIDSFIIVQISLFTKKLDFKKPAIARVIATVVSGGLGIIMALNGYGVWSLVMQSLLSALLFVVVIWIASNWRPGLHFELNAIKGLWGFSSRLFLSGILDGIFSRLDIVIIGKMFSANTLGFYTRAQTFNNLISQYTSGSIGRVFFPSISIIQDNTEEVRLFYKKTINIVSFLVFGLLGFLLLCATDIFIFLFTVKWLPAVTYFKLLLLSGYVYPLSVIMIGVLSGRGKSGKFLKLEILKKALVIFAFIIGFAWGIVEFLYGLALVNFLSLLLNMYFVQNEIRYPLKQQFQLVFGYSLIAAISSLMVLFITPWFSDVTILYIIQTGLLFSTIYILLNLILRTPGLSYLVMKFKEILIKYAH